MKKLGYHDKPPYEKLHSILQAGLKEIQAKDDGKLEFAAVNGTASPPAQVSYMSDNRRTGLTFISSLNLPNSTVGQSTYTVHSVFVGS